MEQNEKEYVIPETVLVSLLQYLYTRPYKEVAQGVQALESLNEVESKE